MSTTSIIGTLIALIIIGALAYLFLMPGSLLAPTAQVTNMGAPTASLSDFENAVVAAGETEGSEAQNSEEVNADLTEDQGTITNITNSTNDSNF